MIEQVVVGNDPAMLANLVRLCADELRHYQKTEGAAEAVADLADAVGALVSQGGVPFVVQALRGYAVALREIDLISEAKVDMAAVIDAIRAIGPVLADVYAQGRDKPGGNER